uniref:Protein phosphatase 1 regulatory subunit 12B n=1 Tax=Cacopsylla melanoneura TaxID=428564 RepID=A0A8D8PRZ3_9HEMI
MDVKNYVGQTCFDIADPELITFLEDLRKKQASMERSQQDINNIANKQQMRNNVLPKRRLSTDRSPLSKSGAEVPKPGGGGDNGSSLRGEEDAGTPADKMAKVEMRERSAPSGNDRSEPGLKNQLNREDTSPKISQNNNINNTPSVPNNNTVTSPTSPKTEEEIFWKPASGLRRKTTDTTRNAVNLNLPKDVDSSDPSQTEGTPPDVALRRTRSFDTDEKFLRRYLELRAKIQAGNSCPSLVNPPSPTSTPTNAPNLNTPTRTASLKERPLWRRGTAVTKEDSSRTSVNTPAAVNTTSNPGSPPSSTTTSPQNSLTTSVRRSFVPPVRDEESETQRKAHAKRVRETRRSTQGVTLEELKSAEQLVKKKQQQQLVQASQQPPSPEKETPDNSDRSNTTHSQSNSLPPHPPGVTVSATITSNSSSSPLAHTGERRPSWRLRVDNGVKFMLEDARDNPSNTDRTRGATDTAETTVTIPLRRPGKLNVDSDKEQDKENDSRNAQATQAVIQRRKRPKRRSTGVVHVDLDEILDRGDDSNHTQSGGDNIKKAIKKGNM